MNEIKGVVDSGRVPVFLSSIQKNQPKVIKSEGVVEEKESQEQPLKPTESMVSHGFGVYEDAKGDVWYKGADGYIYKNTNEEDLAVQRAMKR